MHVLFAVSYLLMCLLLFGWFFFFFNWKLFDVYMCFIDTWCDIVMFLLIFNQNHILIPSDKYIYAFICMDYWCIYVNF